MTDATPTFTVEGIFPDGPDPVDHALTQLREPRHLLAEALDRVRRADQVHAAADRLLPPLTDQGHTEAERHLLYVDHLTRTAEVITLIARSAADMAVQERQATLHAVDDFLDEHDTAPAPRDEPEAVQLRFTADIVGMPVGRVSGRAWVWLPGYGFIDVTDGSEFDVEGNPGYTLTGRVVSLTADHAMVVLPSGMPACLSRELLTLEPDE